MTEPAPYYFKNNGEPCPIIGGNRTIGSTNCMLVCFENQVKSISADYVLCQKLNEYKEKKENEKTK